MNTPTLDQIAPKIDEARRAGFSDDEIIKELEIGRAHV